MGYIHDEDHKDFDFTKATKSKKAKNVAEAKKVSTYLDEA